MGKTLKMSGMPASYHSVQVRIGEKGPVVELLETDPALSLFDYFVGESVQGWVAVFPQRIDKGVKTAKSMSHKLHTDAFSLRTFAQDAFLYSYFRNGEKHDEYCSSPDVMKQLQDMDDEMASIVLQWEQGDLTAEEYRARVDEYLVHFDERKSRVLAEIERVIGSSWNSATLHTISDLVTSEFRGKEADQLIRDIVAKRFPSVRIDEEMRGGRSASSGGKPNAYGHLAHDVAAVDRLLRAGGPAPDQMRQFASMLGMPNVAASFQHEIETPTGLLRVSGSLA